MNDSSTFDASARQAIDSRSRMFADSWFRPEGKDLTESQGVSYGGLLRLPVFLSCQKNGGDSNNSWKRFARAIVSTSWGCLRMLAHRKRSAITRTADREFVFLFSKYGPYGAIAKTLDPILRSLHKQGEQTRVWTFDKIQRAALQAQYPDFLCENLTDVRVTPRDVWAVAWMLVHASVRLLCGRQRRLMYEPLTQLLYHAPRFLQIQTGWKTLWHPGMVILSATEMHPLERLVFTLANNKHVPTVLIQHGITNDTIKNEIVNTPSIASRLCVWGTCAKAFFVSHGVMPERICVTGSPALSVLFTSQKTPKHADALAQLALPDTSLILFSGQNFDEEKNAALVEMSLEAFGSILKIHPATKLVITPHPAKSPYTTDAFYKRLVQKHGFKEETQVFIRSTKNIYDLVNVCDILITSSSTLHVEATLLEKAIILLNIDDVQDMEMVRMKAALGAHTTHELRQCLELLQDQGTRMELASSRVDFLQAYATYPQDATKNILAIIRNLPSPV